MSESSVAPADLHDVVNDPEPVIAECNHPQVLITEQAVVFSTAAAVSVPRTRPFERVIAALHAIFLRSPERPAQRRYPPRRDDFLEHAAMEREMHRL